MSTIGALVDRVVRDYLANPADTPVQVTPQGGVNDSQTSVVYAAGQLAPEELGAIGPGTVIEWDAELMRVTAHNETARTLTVARALYGTTAADHTTASLILVAPRWTRKTVFDAIADEIEGLYPDLYTVGTEWVDPADNLLQLDTDFADAIHVISARQLVGGEYMDIDADILHTDDGLVLQAIPISETAIHVRFTMPVLRPTDETSTYASLGLETSWDRILIYGVLSWILLSADIDAVTQEFISESLEAQGFPATTGTSLSTALLRMRETEIAKAARRQRARFNAKQSYRREL